MSFSGLLGKSGAAKFALCCGVYAIFGGLITLIGWTATLPRLTDWDSSGISMMPNAALGAMSAGAALVLLALGRRRAAAIVAFLPGLLGAATVFQYLSGIDLGIDTLLIYREWGQRGTLVPGRMGPPGSTSFTLLGAAMILTAFGNKSRQASAVCGMVVIAIAMLSIVGYMFGADRLFAVPYLTTIALQTATILLALGSGVVASVRETEPMKTLSDDSPAGVLVRRAIPYVVLAPIVLSWIGVQGLNAGLYDAAFETAAITLLLIALFVGGLWRMASEVRNYETPLRESRERLHSVLASVSDRFQTVDREWRFTYHNAAMRRGLAEQGVDADATLGRNLFEVFPEFGDTAGANALRRAMEQRIEVEFEFFYEPWKRWYEVRASPLPEGGLTIVSQDVTLRKTEAEIVAAHERKLRLMTDHAPVLISHCGTDARYKFVNKPFAERFGLTPEKVIGKHIAEVVGQTAYATFQKYVAVALAGKPVEFETEIPYPTGGTQVMHAAYMPERDVSGNVIGLVAAIVNITDRKRAEELLRAQLELTQTITDNSTAALFMMNAQGYCTFMNPAGEKMFGWTFEEISSKPLHEMIHHHHPDGRSYPMDECPIDRALPENFDLREHRDVFIRRAGEFFPVLVAAAPVFADRERLIATVIEVRDITERVAAEQEIAQTTRRKDEFLAILAHELRNPLAPIRNMLEAMKRKDADADILARARIIMDRQLHLLSRLIDDLMDVSRIGHGKIELRRERIELASVVQHAVETVTQAVEQAQHQFTLTLPAQPIYLNADPVRLSQVFANLLNNACKYTRPGGAGRISLTAEREAAQVVVRVTDNGIGLTDGMLTKIFEPFTQVDSSMERSRGGLGIGLGLVKNLVEMHSGTVAARSPGLDQGAEFVVRLPILPEGLPALERPIAIETVSAATARRILIADDNADAASSLAMLLQIMGHEVVTASDGLDAIELASSFRPDLIVLDIGMPNLNGYDTCRRIREQSWSKNTVLIALTGWGQNEDRRRSLEAGFDHHLVKPADPATLMKLLSSPSAHQN